MMWVKLKEVHEEPQYVQLLNLSKSALKCVLTHLAIQGRVPFHYANIQRIMVFLQVERTTEFLC